MIIYIYIQYIQGVPKLFVQINTRGRQHQNKYISIRNIWSLKSTCNVREHFVSGADVSSCVGVADWECVLTFKTALRTGAHQQRFGVNVLAGVLGDRLIGPYILPFRLSGQRYCNFMDYMLPELLEDVPLNVRQRMYFQHDGASAHFSISVRNHLRTTVGNRLIGRGDPVAWLPR